MSGEPGNILWWLIVLVIVVVIIVVLFKVLGIAFAIAPVSLYEEEMILDSLIIR